MLLNDFFYLSDVQTGDGSIKSCIELNAKHKIFDGHFPGNPIVPGVCMLQITKEVYEQVLGYNIQLHKADYLKFLSFINPIKNNRIQIEMNYELTETDAIKVTAVLCNNNTIYFKFKGEFKKKSSK